MTFVRRDDADNIVAILNESTGPDCVEIDPDHPDIVSFLHGGKPMTAMDRTWREADIALSRVVEDLVHILIGKKLLELTDFPVEARQKLVSRRARRRDYAYLVQLYAAEDGDERPD